MGEGAAQEVVAGRRHIIRRPRLTRLLDECEARVILLVAPAGYGKTTLAREWVSANSRTWAWAAAFPADVDVAALSARVASAASTIVPRADERILERLRVAPNPEADADALARILADELFEWPPNAWLVLDDYHHLRGDPQAENFVDTLLANSPINAVVASRERPVWATARKVLYGEMFEVSRNLLALDSDEAQLVLAGTAPSRRHAQAVAALADGWPAIIGLAALAGRLPEVDVSLPDRLYDFVAEELFATVDDEVRDRVPYLALLPDGRFHLSPKLLGDKADAVVSEATRVGILTRSLVDHQLHPLLRSFLDRKLLEAGHALFTRVATACAQALVEESLWDDAFAIIDRLKTAELVGLLIDAGSDEMLAAGRIATLERWLACADSTRATGVGIDLARAEVALRRGLYDEARLEAVRASARLAEADPRYARALIVAGRSAYLADDYANAASAYAAARNSARSEDAQLQAIWGQFLTAEQLEEPEASAYLIDLESTAGSGADAQLRVAVAKLTLAGRMGPAEKGAEIADRALPLLERATDPYFRASFLDSAARTLVLSARYEDALALAIREIAEAERQRLDFARASAFCIRALAESGLRKYQAAHASLDRADAMLHPHDLHQQVEAAAVRGRVFLCQRKFQEALVVTTRDPIRRPAAGMWGEYVATRLLALACSGDFEAAERLEIEAGLSSRTIEVRVLLPAARAIVALGRGLVQARSMAKEAFAVASQVSNYDNFICACRASPEFVRALTCDQSTRSRLAGLFERIGDTELANAAGVSVTMDRRLLAPLSPRETEVLALIEEGKTNREIATVLYISEVTVKVHVRHIFEKLGVKTRTEAALRAAEARRSQAASVIAEGE